MFLRHLLSSIQLLQTLLITSTTASPTDIWHVSIWQAPAPPPGQGPPLTDSSLRDISYLPAQIASIIGAYVLSVLVIGSAILFVGRRLRRAAQASPATLAMEMMKPVKPDVAKAFDPSPVSPSNNDLYGPSPNSTIDMKNNWPSPNKSTRDSSGWGSIAGKGHRKPASIQSSVVTFDESVIEDDKERNQQEMERLYAAVMEHDEKRSTSAINNADGNQRQNPPELQHLRTAQQQQLSSPPPRSEAKSPPRSLAKSSHASSKPTPISIHSPSSSRRSSFSSFGKKRGIRGLPISPPMGSPDLVPDHNDKYGEAEPLTPRYYDDPGPPPPTPQRKTYKSREDVMDASRLGSKSPQFYESSIRTPRTYIPAIPTIQPIPEISIRPGSPSGGSEKSGYQGPITKTKRTPAPLALRTQAIAGSSSQANSLRSAPLPLRISHPTNYNSDRPPSTIKATVLERKAPTHGLRTPRTGVPMTPYSPYMPFTPLTPMTPSRLVTKEERKRREKEEGRRVATIDDAVEEEADIWGDAYP